MIGSVSKAYGWSLEEIIWERSWENVIMYSAVLPSFEPDTTEEEDDNRQVIDMDDHPDEERLRELFKKLG